MSGSVKQQFIHDMQLAGLSIGTQRRYMDIVVRIRQAHANAAPGCHRGTSGGVPARADLPGTVPRDHRTHPRRLEVCIPEHARAPVGAF